MTRFTVALAAALALVVLVGVGCGSASAAPLEVTYYYLPGWPICDKVKPAVSGLEQEFEGRAIGDNVDATTPESTAVCKELGFRNHGLVVRDAAGTVLWKQADHEVVVEDARRAIRDLLKKT